MWGYNSIQIAEPLWGQQLMLTLNDFMMRHTLLVDIIPYTADIFVFTYPMYLVVVYLWGINKKKIYYKHAALYVFFSGALAVILNLIIQYFGDKSRPELMVQNQDNLLLSHVPSDPFPSDHASVSAAIAMATMLWWIQHNDKFFIRLSWFFWFACLAMSISRIAVAVHRPTDIIAGIGVGMVSASLLSRKPLWHRFQHTILKQVIQFEKRLFKKILWITQQ